MQLTEKKYYLPEEYLELEIVSEVRHEYIDGEIITMTGGTPNHNQIAGNFYAPLHFAVKGKPYQLFVTDQRLWISKRRIYTYPDVMVVALPLQFQEGRRDTITSPLIIVEVLSKSTRNYDKDEKFAAYRTLPSFQEYILIDQDKIQVEQYSKTVDRKWLFSEYEDPNNILSLTSLPFEISLADIYDKIDWEIE
jgi:Uma2 family endonuclease